MKFKSNSQRKAVMTKLKSIDKQIVTLIKDEREFRKDIQDIKRRRKKISVIK